MSEQVATPAASVPRDSHTTATNIVNGISNRVNGRAPAAPPVNNGQPPVDPSASKPVDPNAGKEKYVVEGKEVWLSPDQARAYVQKGIAFEPKMDQLARLQQEQAVLMRTLINDPGKVLTNIAKQNNLPMKDLVQKVLKGNASDDVKEAVGQWYYETAVEPLKLSPEELKAREDARWRQERENQDKTSAQQAIIRENQERASRAYNEIKANISEAMKESGLPSNDTPLGAEMARLVADTMRVAHFQRQSITPKQAIEHVKKRIKAVNVAYFDTLEGEALVKELGESNAEKVKQYFLRLASGMGGAIPTVPKGKPAVRSGERKTLNMDDFHDQLDALKKQG